jgi:hypothetical protein
MEKAPAPGSPPDETSSDDLLRLADRLIDLSRRERERIASSMPTPSDEWLEATARLAEVARQTPPTPDTIVGELALEEALAGEMTPVATKEAG